MEITQKNWFQRTEDFFVNWARAGLLFVIAWIVLSFFANVLFQIFGDLSNAQSAAIGAQRDLYQIAILAAALLLLAFRIESYVENMLDLLVLSTSATAEPTLSAEEEAED